MKMKNSTKETEIGLIPEEWEVMSFNEICTLQRGFDLPQAQREKGVHPLVSASGISDHISEYKVSAPGVVTGRSGTLGQSFFITENFWPLNTTLWVKDFKGNDPYFIYVLLGSLNLEDFNAGSGVPTLNRNHLDQIKVSLPSIEEQRQIASILSSLDDKIELNRQINANLEKMASALFKRWFVDFEFPDENGRPYKSSGGKMVETEMGEVPEGWSSVPFANTVEIISGGTPKTTEASYWGGNIPWFSIVDAPNEADVFVVDTEKKVTNAGIENSAAQILKEGTTIVTARGTVGKIALVGVPMAVNQSCYGLRGKLDQHGYYTYFNTKMLITALQNSAHGSVFDTITRETFTGIDTVLPLANVVALFEKTAEPLLLDIKNNLFELHSLSRLRDSLLPRLMNGKIRIII